MRGASRGFHAKRGSRTFIVADGQREVAQVVDREGSDPFVPGGARPRHRFLQCRLGPLAIACREQNRSQVAQRIGDEARIVRLSRAAARASSAKLGSPQHGRPGEVSKDASGCEGSPALRRSPVWAVASSACSSRRSPFGEVPTHVPVAAERHGRAPVAARLRRSTSLGSRAPLADCRARSRADLSQAVC